LVFGYDKTFFHNEYVIKQPISNIDGALIKVAPHDDLEKRKYIISQVTFAQAILASMVGPKGCKNNRWKIKEVDTNVDNFFISAHGSSMQTRVLI